MVLLERVVKNVLAPLAVFALVTYMLILLHAV